MVYSNQIDRLPHRPNIGVNKLVNFCQSLDLIDIWRVKTPGEKQYTWSNRDRSLHSRTDYIYLLYIQWGKKVFSQPSIVQVIPLKKMRE
ncbi:unnamed protein product [Oncorhynchus mykiss]|uniref:Uncharacterized protein n=1 Tax=Oncorhynchus mykiss TaxID=8022 RepID=A0A060VQT7_ONCMY|nr:unnamed protein product [Oncorhynchus mykiss]